MGNPASTQLTRFDSNEAMQKQIFPWSPRYLLDSVFKLKAHMYNFLRNDMLKSVIIEGAQRLKECSVDNSLSRPRFKFHIELPQLHLIHNIKQECS